MKNVAIILAGGIGSRFGLDIPKQFVKIAGKTIIEHTIDKFDTHDLIDEILIVIHKEWKEKLFEIINDNKYKKSITIIEGGKERKDSSLNAINYFIDFDEDINMIFHDSVRPFVSYEIISECIQKLDTYNAIDVAIPATDTIIRVEKDIIKDIPKRSDMMQGQTPQAFKLSTIKKAYDEAKKDSNFKPTDDCGIVKKYLPNEEIFVVQGDIKNIKITHYQDIFIADKLFQINTNNFDSILDDEFYKKLSNKVLVIFGASYGIGKEISEIAKKFNAKVYELSRSQSNTNVAFLPDIQTSLDMIYEKEGRIDYIVNTASILIKESFNEISYDKLHDIVYINYFGALYIAKESFKYLKASHGHLINFTSSSYTRGRKNYALYSSTKAAIVNLTQALAEEWIEDGVKINCINPERTLTPMRVKNFGKENPETLLDAKDVAYSTINTLLTNITGQIIDIKVHKK